MLPKTVNGSQAVAKTITIEVHFTSCFQALKKRHRDHDNQLSVSRCVCLCLQTEHSRKGTFSVFVEDISDDREILTDIVIFVMCEACH